MLEVTKSHMIYINATCILMVYEKYSLYCV